VDQVETTVNPVPTANARMEDLNDVDAIPCACATIRRASRVVTQLYDGWLRAHGIEGPQFALLAMLERLGECNQATLGQRFDLDKTTLSRNVRLLRQKGWIAALPGRDARERRIRLTTAGRRRLARARPAWREAQRHLRSSLRTLDWDTMLTVLNDVTRAARHAARSRRGRIGRR
jgi:DNA-binding MarR family transcriptional regulator